MKEMSVSNVNTHIKCDICAMSWRVMPACVRCTRRITHANTHSHANRNSSINSQLSWVLDSEIVHYTNCTHACSWLYRRNEKYYINCPIRLTQVTKIYKLKLDATIFFASSFGFLFKVSMPSQMYLIATYLFYGCIYV